MAAAVRRGALPAAALTISAANPAGQQYCTSECPPRIRLAASKHPCTELSVTASGLAWLGARTRGDGVHGGAMKLRCRPTRSRRVPAMTTRLDHYRLLGRSGLRMSPFALGTMTFGVKQGWGTEDRKSTRLNSSH